MQTSGTIYDFSTAFWEMIDVWTIERISEADYGCEERLPGEPLKVRVMLMNGEGVKRSVECAEEWLTAHGLDKGSEWVDEQAGD